MIKVRCDIYFVRVRFSLDMLCLRLLMIKVRCHVFCKVLLEYAVFNAGD